MSCRRYLRGRYARLFLATAAVLAGLVQTSVATAGEQASIRSLTEIILGHQVGGVTIDLTGKIYVADFADTVWQLTPEGVRGDFATDFYGASGNAIDNRGNLLQASYYGNFVSLVDRHGQSSILVEGLKGPVGIAVDRKNGDIYVANCNGNTIAKIGSDHAVSTFAEDKLFNCPNGLAFDASGNLYVVNFRDNNMLRVDSSGAVTPFAKVSDKGLGHLCFKHDRFYVAGYASHSVYEVTLRGDVQRILGNGERGLKDGYGESARLSFPNGIACHPWTNRLYVNEMLGASEESIPRRAIVREIHLPDR